MDRLSRQHRSWNMSRIRSSDTAPERIVRSALHRLGFRFRKASGLLLPGKPDVVLPHRRTVVFVHGCFWHRHPGCKYAYSPKSRVDFWMKKFHQNILRDAVVATDLRNKGWRVVTVWECETRDLEKLKEQLVEALR